MSLSCGLRDMHKVWFNTRGGRMLKRYQILLEDWQADYCRRVAKKVGISHSEYHRIILAEDMVLNDEMEKDNYTKKDRDSLMYEARNAIQ